ncbi:MAG: hypothetical protein LC792_10345, partial [Actinobacteria bacterium]|nr:hypothetical protein [Actinomycetota bacterium]
PEAAAGRLISPGGRSIGRLQDRAEQEGLTTSQLDRRHLNTVLGINEPAIPLVILRRFIDRQAHYCPTCPAGDRVAYIEADELEGLLSRYEEAVGRRGTAE